MLSIEKKLAKYLTEETGKLLLRLSVAILILFHGFKKFSYGISGVKALVLKAGLPEFLAYGVYMGELIIPFLLIIGLFTRISALILSVTMMAAIFLAYSDKLLMLDAKTGGPLIELPLLYLLASLSIAFLGAGKYSLDRKIHS
ncbi:MAG: putative oxidoreductase CatD [Proteobacteria bacterium]|nr:putative oxidoreductase CatD [Pseudomonadota bacterium]